MDTKTHIIVHHTYSSAKSGNDQFDAVKNFHVKEKGWIDIGYQFFIEHSGEIKKGRPINSVGTHCYQQNMNVKSVGICLAGNFDIEEPTKEQLISLKKLFSEIKTRFNILDQNILLHRDFANYKSCPGVKITKHLISKLIKNEELKISHWAEKEVEWCKKNKIINDWSNPQSQPTKEELAVILYRFANLAIKDL